ncbi:MAG: 2'-5' RNA ligase family protein [Ferruginibacter sp.]
MKVLIKTPSQSFIRSNTPTGEIKGFIQGGFAHGLFEYLLILSPMGALRDKIIEEKKYFFEMYRNCCAIYGRPHITLANFLLPGSGENEIIQHLIAISENQNKMRVMLQDYKWFAQHTMYLNILYKVDIMQLVRKITNKTTRVINSYSKFPPRFILEPHLTICKELSVEQYAQSRIEYTRKRFSGSFTANEMILLKRNIGEKDRYEEVYRLEFGGTETLTTILQGNLFQ